MLHSYWKLLFIVDLPIENNDFPIAISSYQRVSLRLFMVLFHCAKQTHRPVYMNSTSSKVITKGDAISQPTEVQSWSQAIFPQCENMLPRNPEWFQPIITADCCRKASYVSWIKMENFANQVHHFGTWWWLMSNWGPRKNGRPTYAKVNCGRANLAESSMTWASTPYGVCLV